MKKGAVVFLILGISLGILTFAAFPVIFRIFDLDGMNYDDARSVCLAAGGLACTGPGDANYTSRSTTHLLVRGSHTFVYDDDPGVWINVSIYDRATNALLACEDCGVTSDSPYRGTLEFRYWTQYQLVEGKQYRIVVDEKVGGYYGQIIQPLNPLEEFFLHGVMDVTWGSIVSPLLLGIPFGAVVCIVIAIALLKPKGYNYGGGTFAVPAAFQPKPVTKPPPAFPSPGLQYKGPLLQAPATSITFPTLLPESASLGPSLNRPPSPSTKAPPATPSTRICPSCNAVLPVSARFCNKCGHGF